jgi:hypothetical protein
MTTTTNTALTREHTIKALEKAEGAVFRWDGSESGLTLSKEVERGDGFGRQTLCVEIPTRLLVRNLRDPLAFGDQVKRAAGE